MDEFIIGVIFTLGLVITWVILDVTDVHSIKFTRLTYLVAIRRAFKKEYQAFSDHQMALRGPDPWIRLRNHTDALRARKIREKK